MTKQQFIKAIGNLDDDIIEAYLGTPFDDGRAVKLRAEKSRSSFLKFVGIAAAVVCAAAAAIFAFTIFPLPNTPADVISESGDISDSGIPDISSASKDEKTPVEFTKEDEELQNILKELSPGEELRDRFIYGFLSGDDHSEQTFKFNCDPELDGIYVLTPSGRSQSGLMYPQTREELYKLLLKYFTFSAADSFMSEVETVVKSENPDGTFTIESTVYASLPTFFITADGIYRKKDENVSTVSGFVKFPWNAGKVVSKTDDTIIFTYLPYPTYPELDENGNPIYPELEDIDKYNECALKGVLKYERGGWRLNLTRAGFDFENDPPIMVKDEEFPDIMQGYMEQDSFNDKLRHIILTAASVEELERNVKALDTESRVNRILVTEYSDDPTYYKIGKPVTSGSIESGKTAYISVLYDDSSDGVVYWYGSWIDTIRGEFNNYESYGNKINMYIKIADTVDELKELIRLGDFNKRITAVRIYRKLGEGKREEITSGKLDTGMTVRVEFDVESYQEFSKTSSVTIT